MTIIARSRIGFWTAFTTAAGSYLNIRDEHGVTATIALTPEDARMLADDARTAHAHAGRLLESGARLPIAMPTPPITVGEPAPHDWEPASTGRMRLKAA